MFKRSIAMPIALAAAVIGGSLLTADAVQAQGFRYGGKRSYSRASSYTGQSSDYHIADV